MCITNYIHYHHIPPCTRPITYSYHYTFCAAARYDPITSHPLEPCDSVSTSSPYGDLNDPCSMSQCMVDRRCSSGACRLEDLNGRFDRPCFHSWLFCEPLDDHQRRQRSGLHTRDEEQNTITSDTPQPQSMDSRPSGFTVVDVLATSRDSLFSSGRCIDNP
ncbi:hypothetical protein HYE68_007342 [Fusarium pseudograminearum]|nr:hypothetical protein HYE68_007342 [Fusarium pseudograminearum]